VNGAVYIHAMKHDEFAFFNQQLAAMLRDGIPLEGALKQLCAGMKQGRLRAEIERLEEDLARGVPLKEALPRRTLPELYRRMVEIGVRSNDLPGVLILLADHYQKANAIWNRLKGLMVYPLIVIGVSLVLTTALSLLIGRFLGQFGQVFGTPAFPSIAVLWTPPIVLAIAAVLGVAAVSVPAWRARLRWRLPAFRDASLAQLASAMALMLENGTPLPEALALAEALESGTAAGRALAEWRRGIEAGQGKPAQWPKALPPFPPMFLWLVQKGGEDLAAGFRQTAGIYHARAAFRVELALYGALPVSVLLLGQMVVWQVVPIFIGLTSLMNSLGQ
jgi:type IV pilus assembly protein PilC